MVHAHGRVRYSCGTQSVVPVTSDRVTWGLVRKTNSQDRPQSSLNQKASGWGQQCASSHVWPWTNSKLRWQRN